MTRLAGIAVAAALLGLAVAAAVTRPAGSTPLFVGIRAGFAIDGLSAVLVVTVTATALAVLVFAAAEIRDASGRFAALMLLFECAMLVTVTATTLAPLLMGWELMGAASWTLIGFHWRDEERVHAANVAFLTTRAADLGLYLAAGAALAGGVGSLALAQLPQARAPWLDVVTLGVVLAAFGKSAQLPFSFWLSRAMQGPSSVSALLHSATMVAAGAYLLLRLEPLLRASGWGAPTVAWTGAATALLLGLVAVAQRDLKQLLAASTCAQIGFMVLAAGTGGIAGGTMQLVAHATTKSLLFLAAGAWLSALGTKQLPALRGAARRYPLVGVAFTVGAVSLAGLPPASLWVAKDELLASALEESSALYTVGLAAAVVSALYSVKAIWFLWRPLEPGVGGGYDAEEQGSRVVPATMRMPLAALAVPAAALGVLALPGIAGPLRRTIEAAGEPRAAAWELALSGALAALAAAAAWHRGGREWPLPAAFARWLDLERLAFAAVVQPTLALARALARLDDSALNGAVLATAAGGRTLANLADRRGEASVSGGVDALVAASRRLGTLARRPQTGQLHQYYAQAVVALALLALVFAVVR